MPIQYEFSNKEDLIYPIVICDVCGEQIIDAKQGNVHWSRPELNGTGPWRVEKVYFVHKKCNRLIDDTTYWEELSRFSMQLMYHLGQESAAKAAAEALKDGGTQKTQKPKKQATSRKPS